MADLMGILILMNRSDSIYEDRFKKTVSFALHREIWRQQK